MEVVSFPTASAFSDAARFWLQGAEREHNLILSVLQGSVRRNSPARGWLVTAEGAPHLALFQVPPHYVLLSRGTAEAVRCAAGSLEAELPGVLGLAAEAEAFAAGWSRRIGTAAFLNTEMTFYTLDSVQPYRRPGGCLRRAGPEEFELLAPLATAAARDMNLPAAEQRPEGSWIRAMASYVDVLPGAGARIRGVYTPTEFRGRGYGAAVTGALAELLLDEGQSWVSLFADNANPISTGIYLRLGFRPEGVYRSYRFEPV